MVVLVLGGLGAFTAFENSVWDLRVRTLAAPSAATSQIDVVLLDQASLDWAESSQGQSWPWPREYFAAVVDYLTRAEAKVVVFDVIFDQPSVLSGDDAAFARAVAANGRVVFAQSAERRAQGWLPSPPTAELASAAARLGHVSSVPDSDGVNRRAAPSLPLAGGESVPSLSLAAWSLGTGQAPPAGPAAEVLLRYRGASGVHRQFAAREILNSEFQLREGEPPQVDPAVFRDHYVFFGYSAPGLLDLRPSPVDNKYPGVLVHATALDNLLAGDVPRGLDWSWSALLVAVWSLGAALAVGRIRRAAATAPVFLLALGLPVAAGWLAYGSGWWLPVVPPVVGALAAGLAMLLVNYSLEGRQKRFIQNAFGQYLSPEVIARLVADPDQLKLGGEKRCLSIFFSDVAGFTSISERLKDDPVALTALLNDYLSEMTSIIYAHGGTIDKYEGDAIIAFWNAPVDLPDHALQAVRASLACQKKLAEIGPRLARLAGRPFEARIGLNTGDVVIGNMGSTQRFNYTFLGDAGNLASRLEGINKLFGTRFLASEFTRQACGPAPDLTWREIGRVRVVGKSLPVTVYEPWPRDDAVAVSAVLEAFDKGLRDWYRGAFAEALVRFEAHAGADAPCRMYAEKTRELIAAPPPSWEGIWDAKEK